MRSTMKSGPTARKAKTLKFDKRHLYSDKDGVIVFVKKIVVETAKNEKEPLCKPQPHYSAMIVR